MEEKCIKVRAVGVNGGIFMEIKNAEKRKAARRDLGEDEICDGLMYTAITRVTKTENLGFAEGITFQRIGPKIKQNKGGA